MPLIKGFFRHIREVTRKHFLTGLLVIVPLGLTFFVVSWIVRFMDRFLAFLPPNIHPDTYLPFPIPGLGLIITLIVIQIVGLLSANLFGRRIVRSYERLLDRIPLVRGVYVAVKQLLEQILSSPSDRFRRTVLVEYPRKGIYSIGFVTGESKGAAQDKTPMKVLNVFIPTTPNPTSGYYLLVPEDDVTQLNLTVDQAFKLIISAGIIGTEDAADSAPGVSVPITDPASSSKG